MGVSCTAFLKSNKRSREERRVIAVRAKDVGWSIGLLPRQIDAGRAAGNRNLGESRGRNGRDHPHRHNDEAGDARQEGGPSACGYGPKVESCAYLA